MRQRMQRRVDRAVAATAASHSDEAGGIRLILGAMALGMLLSLVL